MVCARWAKRFEGTVEQIIINKKSKWSTCYITFAENGLGYTRTTQRWLKETQKLFLNKLLDDGLRSGNKTTAEKAEKKNVQRIRFWRLPSRNNNKDYLPVTTIKSYFSKRAAKEKKRNLRRR